MALTAAQQSFVRRVQHKVDAQDSAGSNIYGSDTEWYASCQEAARQFILEAPKSVIQSLAVEDATALNDEVTPNAANVVLPMPTDFLRLHTLWVYGWTAPVYEEVVEQAEDDEYRDAVRAGVGSVDRPRVFQVYNDPTGSDYAGYQALDCYPGTTNTTPVTVFIYFPVTAPELFAAAITEPLLWLSAGIHFMSIDPELSAMCSQRYRERLTVRRQIRPVTLTRKIGMI